MLGGEGALEEGLGVELGHACVGGVVGFEELVVFHANELVGGLERVLGLGEQQPALQVVEAQALEGQLNGALVVNLVATWPAPQRSRITLTASTAVRE